MIQALIGVIAGVVIGIVIGTSLIAPRLEEARQRDRAETAGTLLEGAAETRESADSAAGSADGVAANDDGGQRPRPDARDRVEWRVLSAFQPSLPVLGDFGKRFARETGRISGGRIALDVRHRETAPEKGGLVAAVQRGDAVAALVAPWRAAAESPALALFGAAPFGPPPTVMLAWLYGGEGRQLHAEIYAERGLHAVPCGMTASAGAMWFREPIPKATGLGGQRIRIDGLAARVVREAGASIVDVPPAGIADAFENGRIDAAAYSLPSVDRALGIHETAGYYYFPGWSLSAPLIDLVVSAETWESLAPADRKVIEAVCGDNVRHGLAKSEARQFAALLDLGGVHVDVRRWPDDVIVALRDAWRRVSAELATNDSEFERTWRSLHEFRRDHDIWRGLTALENEGDEW